MNNRVSGYLGLANRAGKALVGEAITKVWSKRKIYLLIMALDAVSKTQKKLAKQTLEQNLKTIYAYRKTLLC